MHGLQACIFKYITVTAFRIYALHDEDCAKSHGNYIVDHGKSWKNQGILFLNFCRNPEISDLFKLNHWYKTIF